VAPANDDEQSTEPPTTATIGSRVLVTGSDQRTDHADCEVLSMKLRALVLSVALVFSTLTATGVVGIVPAGNTGTGNTPTTTAPDCSTVGYAGSGTASDPHEITNVSQLQCVGQHDRGAHYELVENVDASGTDQWNGGAGFSPIGDESAPFTGSLHGQDHDVTGLTIDGDGNARDTFGLFGATGGSVTVEHLDVSDANVSATPGSIGNLGVGILVGYHGEDPDTVGTLTVRRVRVSGNVTTERSAAGGIVGANDKGHTIDEQRGRIVITQSHANVSVHLRPNFEGSPSGEAGGLVGFLRGVADSYTGSAIRNSSATGSITGYPFWAGGLVGDSDDSSIEHSIAAVDMTGIESASESSSVASGGVLGESRRLDLDTVYWDVPLSGETSARGGGSGSSSAVVGLNTAEMQGSAAASNMAGLDFAGTWVTRSGEYPTTAYFVPAAPVALDDAYSVPVNGSIGPGETDVLGNDSDANLDQLSATLVTGPSNGSVTLFANGSFTYAPDASFVGEDSFTYAATDGTGRSGEAQVNLTVVDQDLRSLAYNRTDEGEIESSDPTGYHGYYEPVTFAGTAGDVVTVEMTAPEEDTYLYLLGPTGTEIAVDDDGGPGLNSRIDETVLPVNGTYTIVATTYSDSDTFRYTLALDRTGVAAPPADLRSIGFNETRPGAIDIGDPTGHQGYYEPVTFDGTAGNVVTIEMSSSPGDPALVLLGPDGRELERNEDAPSGGEDGEEPPALTLGHREGGSTLSRIELFTLPSNGTYTIVATSDDASATFPYDLTLTRVSPTNRPPVAGDDHYSTVSGQQYAVSTPGVLANDTDPEADALRPTVTARPSAGTVTLDSDGSFRYTPDPGFTGTDSFTYAVTDATGDTDQATVTVDVVEAPTDVAPGDLPGTGTESDPYVITNVSELQAIEDDLTGHYVLGSDVDASSTTGWDGGAGFTPIAGVESGFSGSFDGRGYAITGLTIDRPGTDDVGLFGLLTPSGTITNVSLLEASVSAEDDVGLLVGDNVGTVTGVSTAGTVTGDDDVGGVVGDSQSFGGVVRELARDAGPRGVVRNADATVSVQATGDAVGGVVGEQDGLLRASSADADVLGNDEVGGLAGKNTGLVDTSNARGSVRGSGDLGGLVGENSGLVTNSSASSDVEGGSTGGAEGGAAADVGGVVGFNGGSVRDVYATGSVSGGSDVGGVIGDQPASATLRAAYATGDVSGTIGSIGGVVGETDGAVSDVYATGTVSGSFSVGPVVGSGTVTDAYWNVNTSSISVADSSATGLTSDELLADRARTTASGLSFTRTWTVLDTETSASFPYLRNSTQSPPPGLVQAPNPGPDRYQVVENGSLSVDAPGVLGNDTDPDGDLLDAELLESPRNGTLGLYRNGSFVYVPDRDFVGEDSFTYEAVDGRFSVTSTVTLSVTEANAAPTAVDDSYHLRENGTLSVEAPGLVANDVDPNRDRLSVTLAERPNHGTVEVAADGSFQYRPPRGFSGTDSFTYEVRDGRGGNDTASVQIETLAPPAFAVDVAGVNESVAPGEDVVIEASVQNDGGVAGTQALTLFANESAVAKRPLSLNASERVTVRFTVATLAKDGPALALTVRSDNDSASRIVHVGESPGEDRGEDEGGGGGGGGGGLDSDPDVPGVPDRQVDVVVVDDAPQQSGTTVDVSGTQTVERITFHGDVGGAITISEYDVGGGGGSSLAPLFERIVEHVRSRMSATGIDVVSLFDLTPSSPETADTAGTVTVSVPTDRLDDPHDAIVVHRGDDGWEVLDPRVEETSGGETTLSVDTDSFSPFAVVAVDSTTPTRSSTATPEPAGDDSTPGTPTVGVTETPDDGAAPDRQVSTERAPSTAAPSPTPGDDEPAGFDPLTILGVFVLVGAVGGGFYALRRRQER
jgi:hypothetical protein